MRDAVFRRRKCLVACSRLPSAYRLVTVEFSCCLKLAPFFSGCFKQLLFEQFELVAQSMLFSLLLLSLFAFSIVADAAAC